MFMILLSSLAQPESTNLVQRKVKLINKLLVDQ